MRLNLSVIMRGLLVTSIAAAAPGFLHAADPTWTTKAALPTAKAFSAGGVIGGTIYVCGGNAGNGNEFSGVDAYDTATDTWSAKAPLPETRVTAGGGIINGTLYVAGGNLGSSSVLSTSLYAYDPAGNSWTVKAPMPLGLGSMVSGVVNGKLFLIGGEVGGSATTAVFAYDPATDSWAARAAMPAPRRRTFGGVIGETIYVAGGYDTGCAVEPTLAYDTLSNTWSTRASMPVARVTDASQIGSAVVNGKLYVIGGECPGYQAEVYEYDPATDSWTQMTSVPTLGVRALVANVNGRIYAIGAHQGTGAYSAVNEAGTLTRLASSLYVNKTTMAQGQTVSLRWGLTNGLANPVTGLSPTLRFTVGGACVSNVTAPSPAGPLTIAANGTTVFTWSFQVSGTGTIAFTVSASGVEAVTSNAVTVTDSFNRAGTESCTTTPITCSTCFEGPSPTEGTLYVFPHPLKCPGGNAVFAMARAGTATLRVTNMRGQVVKEISQDLVATASAQVWIDCTTVKNGAYFLNGELRYADGTTIRLKPYKFVVAGGR